MSSDAPESATPDGVATGAAAGHAAPAVGEAAGPPPGILDVRRTARRLRTCLAVIGALVLLGWGIAAVVAAPSLRLLAELVGLGLLVAFVVEVVVVGGAAVRGLLAAGERGDRLAGGDVSLLPPQLRRRRR